MIPRMRPIPVSTVQKLASTLFTCLHPVISVRTHPKRADGRFLSFRHASAPTTEGDIKPKHISPNLTMSDSNAYVLEHTPPTFQRMFGTNYSAGMETDVSILKRNGQDHTKWTNPLEVRK
jgi:hypothetical protein